MIAGHYATAIVAKQHAPRGHIAFYLAASQLPDLAWYGLAGLGLAPVHSHSGPIDPAMMVSHDLVPTFGWVGLAVVAGRMLFGSWKPGVYAGVLVAAHIVVDLLAGYPHNVLGPDTPLIGTGLYFTAPALAVGIEGLFAAALVGWVALRDRASGTSRAWGTWAGRGMIFGGGIGATLLSAPALAEFDPNASLPLVAVVGLVGLYATQMGILTWGETRPSP